MQIGRCVLLAVVTAMVLALSACGGSAPNAEVTQSKQPADQVSAPPQAEAVVTEAEGLTFSALKGDVEWRSAAGDTDAVAMEGAVIGAGGEVVVAVDSMGLVAWPERLAGEMVGPAELTVQKASAEGTTLAQKSGTARYTLMGDYPLSIEVDGATLYAEAAGVDLLVTYQPDGVWVTSFEGDAEIRRSVAARQGAPVAATSLPAKHGLTLSPDAPEAVPVEMDLPSVTRWYMGLTTGSEERELAAVAFRCQVAQPGAPLAYDPVADGLALDTLETLAKGELLQVLGVEDGEEWLHVAALSSDTEGWVRADDVACMGSTAGLDRETALVSDGPEPAAVEAVEAARPLTDPKATSTPTPAAVAQSGASEGEPSESEGNDSDDSDDDSDSNGQDAAPTPTPCDTECAADAPPTETPRPPRPTREPTDPPAEPTDPPAQPTDPPAEPTEEPPAPPPEPTDEPSEPTDEPEPPPEPTDDGAA